MRNNKVIYTAIFGEYDKLQEPAYIPEGFDFVCFSDKKIPSKTWQVRVVEPPEEDTTRSARKYKVLPHRHLGGYEISVWIDGNICVHGDVNELVGRYLASANMAAYSHAHARHMDRERSKNGKFCIYQEAEDLVKMYEEKGRHKDDLNIIQEQVDRYRKEGYPAEQGLIISTVLLRRHNTPDITEAMEAWWKEIQQGSKRDQLSFNYVAWKYGLNFSYILDNVRENKYFQYAPHSKGKA